MRVDQLLDPLGGTGADHHDQRSDTLAHCSR
jgi:hypothetical protein